MEKKKILLAVAASIAVLLLLSSFVMSYFAFKDRARVRQVIIKTEPPEYKVFAPAIPDEIDFCGEEVPVEDFDVRERIEREMLVNVHWESATLLYLKRSARWFPVIEPILSRYKIPNDFKYLAVVESGLTNAVSPAGAAGFWQLMEPAAKKYGLEVTPEVDERYNIEKATRAACKYLKEAFAKYGSWTMAAASYNYGMNGIDKQIKRQDTKSYFNLYLTEETYRFIFRILAMKEIFKNPAKYGFLLGQEDYYKPIETEKIVVNKEIKDLARFAKENGINYKVLKIFNPWLKENYLPNRNRKPYAIKIPKSGEIEIFEE